jgi:hypothetical protein
MSKVYVNTSIPMCKALYFHHAGKWVKHKHINTKSAAPLSITEACRGGAHIGSLVTEDDCRGWAHHGDDRSRRWRATVTAGRSGSRRWAVVGRWLTSLTLLGSSRAAHARVVADQGGGGRRSRPMMGSGREAHLHRWWAVASRSWGIRATCTGGDWATCAWAMARWRLERPGGVGQLIQIEGVWVEAGPGTDAQLRVKFPNLGRPPTSQ